MTNAKFGVVIVGGGFTGSMLALQLSRRVPSLSVAVIDKGSVPGRALAYATRNHCHLLNVPAGNMSALPEEPDHFLRWARANYDTKKLWFESRNPKWTGLLRPDRRLKGEVRMSTENSATTPTSKSNSLSLDALAVIVALVLALAVRFDIFRNVPW